MENDIPVNDELIARYLAGEATPEEAMVLQAWLALPDNRNHFEGMKAAWHAALPKKKPREINVPAAWSSINSKMHKKPVVLSRKSRMPYLAIAASVLILVTAGLFVYLGRDAVKFIPIVVSTSDSSRHILLPDYSSLILNRNTRISYPESFTGGTREVNLLYGEAFFDVSPDRRMPFIVHTGAGTIRAIGTSFNVSSNAGLLEVSVKEGSVAVYTERDTAILKPGSAAEATAAARLINVKDSVDINAWGYATGMFIFSETPLRHVILSIEKSYPCNIRLTNANVNNCKLTATFEKVSVENMLSLIAETLNLSVTRDGKVFTLEGNGCP